MLNYIWAFMIIIGIIYGSLTGHMAELSNAALDLSLIHISSSEALFPLSHP